LAHSLKSKSGFTLLETLIAVAIMTVTFASILMVESNSIQAVTRTKILNIVSMLIQTTLTETEYLIENKQFTEVKDEETGTYAEPYQDYTWKRKIKEIELPDLSGAASQKEEKEPNTQQNDLLQTMNRILTNFLSKAMREVTVSVSWNTTGKPEEYSVSFYWVNLNAEIPLQ